MRPIYSLTWIAALAVLSLVGCGGGTGSSITPPNPPPPAGPSSVAPTSVTFGNMLVGAAASVWSVTYQNDSSAPLAITAISATGDYSQSNNCGNSLAAGADCSINVIFTPTASGARSGNLQIAGDSPQNVPLSGMGVTMHNVQVSWDASSSLVVGYFVYSSSQSGGPYTLLNASPSPLPPPSFPVSVQGGQTWYFIVTAVDANQVESVPSTEVAATLTP
ncbi:MAG: choice-of-anchor D domain-containing protein [Terriglobales bacterium]